MYVCVCVWWPAHYLPVPPDLQIPPLSSYMLPPVTVGGGVGVCGGVYSDHLSVARRSMRELEGRREGGREEVGGREGVVQG